MSYIKNNFLLSNKVSEELYFKYAKKMPIFDYHCHISEKEILEDKPFKNIYEMWLSGDHYKWRLMRNYGINEELITGKGSPKEKFIAYCEALGSAYLNPLTHWSQLELKEYFNCDIEINKANALKIWNHCNDYLKKHKVTRSVLIKSSNVKYIFTTNEAVILLGSTVLRMVALSEPFFGIAIVLDRLLMILTKAETIRDVIAFPKNSHGIDLMLNAPSGASAEGLEELFLQVKEK